MVPKKWLIATLCAGILLSAGTFLLYKDINIKQSEAEKPLFMVKKIDDSNVDFAAWGQNFPTHLEMYEQTKDMNLTTDFGGSNPYSKLNRYPQLTQLWAGYPFSADFNEERGHYFTQIDQFETKRNNKEYLNAHGFPAFKGQPGACMNCHSGWAPKLIKEMGWEKFNSTPYWDIVKKLEKEHGDSIHGSKMGSTCADCHSPKDMSLRVTRQAYINAMVARGYEADPDKGIKASRQEMRSHVCQQCHVEYYFQGDKKLLTFPWTEWKKGEPLRIENIEAYYEKNKKDFPQDWAHKETKAPMLKMQHPETEMYSSSVHARSGVGCADCHMAYERVGSQKVSNHKIASPMNNLNNACRSCHSGQTEEQLKEKVRYIQTTTANGLRNAENGIVALITDIKAARALIEKQPKFANIADPDQKTKEINKVLAKALDAHRKASMRWDFVFSENSTGFHSPQEAQRIVGQASELARIGQIEVQNALKPFGLTITPTIKATMPPAPQPTDLKNIVGNVAPESVIKIDKTYDFSNPSK